VKQASHCINFMIYFIENNLVLMTEIENVSD
jgi:hypothetical protein